jgi:acetyl-CoA carboxylase carboxyl transferase subunit beta|tara:strand:+ start:1808 stop:2761 length:954 start_codon:yes stop_codon:yes gene_type:complete
MSWITNFVRPKIQALVGKKNIPDNLWQRCPSCDEMLFHRELSVNLNVCHHCNYHIRISAAARLEIIFDKDSYERIKLPVLPTDPLKFRDTKRYIDRLRDAKSNSDENEAILVAKGKVGGLSCVVAAFDFSFMGGSMGQAVGEGFLVAANEALSSNASLITVPASGGARMQEGMLSLIQMPRTVIAVEQVREAGLPYIVILTDPTTGGVSASFAMLGDIHLAEPKAMIGFAGRRVIEDTIREELPEDFQKAERMLDHGLIDMVVHRKDLRDTLIRIMSLLCQKTPNDLTLQATDIETVNIPKTVKEENSSGNEAAIGK